MLSLIPTQRTVRWVNFILTLSMLGHIFVSSAADDLGEFFLDNLDVAPVADHVEVRINFAHQIRYIRHYPDAKGSIIHVSLEVVDPCVAEDLLSQETRWLPPADWYVPVTVTFPESIRRSTTGPALCPVTHNHVYVGHTMLIKFGKEISYKVRPGGDGHSLILEVPLLKPVHPQKPEPKSEVKSVAKPESKQEANVDAVPVAKESVAPSSEKPVAQAVAVASTPVAPSTPAPKASSSPAPVAVPAKSLDKTMPPGSATAPVPIVESTNTPVRSEKSVTPLPLPAKTEPELPAVDLMVAGRAALAAGDGLKATQWFNRLLNLPPNDYSQESQELVGVAREKADEADKAKAEYELYLKLYPTGEGAARVKQRLAALEQTLKAPKKVLAKTDKPKRPVKEVHQNTVTGSVSQYYYTGKSQGTTINGAGETDQTRSTDQSTLITNMDVTGRFRHNQYDTKIVFRDTQVHNAMNRADRNTLSAAYIEHQNKLEDYMFRIGRQSGTSQGVLGRFDGAFARVGINPQWRITAVVGEPDNGSRSTVKTNRHFYGAGVEFGPLAEKWSGTLYGIQQVADGIVERRAVGTELRYFSGTTTWFGLLDYDTVYDAVNMAMLQGNWVLGDGYNFNMLLDHRKSPILYGETAIQAVTGALSVADVHRMLSTGDIYSTVKALVPESDMAMLGVTKHITPHWQLGGDVRVVHIGATDGSGAIAAQPGIDNNYTYTLQAIGSNTLFKNDTSVMMASFVDDPTYHALSLGLTNSLMYHDNWRFDTSLRYYREIRDAGQRTWQVSPSLRMSYRMKDNLSFELQLNVDRTHTNDPVAVTVSDNWREMLFAGYRWDFR